MSWIPMCPLTQLSSKGPIKSIPGAVREEIRASDRVKTGERHAGTVGAAVLQSKDNV